MKFKDFANILEKVEKTSARNKMESILSDLFKSFERDDICPAVYLLNGRIVPKFLSLEFNFARKLMIRALSDAFNVNLENIKESFKSVGDLGSVAEFYNKKKDSNIKLIDVYQHLCKVASLTGKGSHQGKINEVVRLIKDCDKLSSKYVMRMILGNMRLGVSDKSILDSLSMAIIGDKSKRGVLDRAYGVRGDIGFLAREVLTHGIKGVEKIKIMPGVPIASMLCEREASEDEIFKRSPIWFVQPKYDGLRCQIHYSKKGFRLMNNQQLKQFKLLENKEENTRIFSRNQENLTKMFPDIEQAVRKLSVSTIVLDGEAIGYNESSGKYIPFQETIQRKRKYDIKKAVMRIPIKLFVFDILYLNGRDLSEKPFTERIEVLEHMLSKSQRQDIIKYTPTNRVSNLKDLKVLFDKYINEGMEGVIFKLSESGYEFGRRGFSWIKLKKSSKGYLVDSIDAIVLGYYHGRGARAKFGIGAILIGIYNKVSKKYESIAKVGTGIKDDDWQKIKKRLGQLSTEQKLENVYVKKELAPDVWVKPEVIIVVSADEITKSPNHTAGFKEGKGYSLRFPRLIGFDRKDKDIIDVTSISEIKRLYSLQHNKKEEV